VVRLKTTVSIHRLYNEQKKYSSQNRLLLNSQVFIVKLSQDECTKIKKSFGGFSSYFPGYRNYWGGEAYHYTSRFAELDKTQTSLVSPAAKHDPGVVFAYMDQKDAVSQNAALTIIIINLGG
jgi:hypothetical protein